MTTDLTTATRDDVDQAVRRAIEALAGLGSIERLHPVDRARIAAAAAAFTREIRNITRRTGSARRGKRGTRRGSVNREPVRDPSGCDLRGDASGRTYPGRS